MDFLTWLIYGGTMKNGLGTAALVLGIAGVLGSLVAPRFVYIVAILAIVFGAIGLSRARKGTASNATVSGWGLALGIAGFFLALFNVPSVL